MKQGWSGTGCSGCSAVEGDTAPRLQVGLPSAGRSIHDEAMACSYPATRECSPPPAWNLSTPSRTARTAMRPPRPRMELPEAPTDLPFASRAVKPAPGISCPFCGLAFATPAQSPRRLRGHRELPIGNSWHFALQIAPAARRRRPVDIPRVTDGGNLSFHPLAKHVRRPGGLRSVCGRYTFASRIARFWTTGNFDGRRVAGGI